MKSFMENNLTFFKGDFYFFFAVDACVTLSCLIVGGECNDRDGLMKFV